MAALETAAPSTVHAYDVGEPLVQFAVKVLAVAPTVAVGSVGEIAQPAGVGEFAVKIADTVQLVVMIPVV